MVAGFWPAAEKRAGRNSPFLTRRALRRSNQGFLALCGNIFRFPKIWFRYLQTRWNIVPGFLMGRLSLSKEQRLTSKKEIDTLFVSGKSFNLMPIRVIYAIKAESNSRHKVLFSVPSRVFKKAVDRNLIRRRMRESYRINQSKLDLSLKFNLAYIYIAKQILPYSDIEKKIIQSFQRLSNEARA